MNGKKRQCNRCFITYSMSLNRATQNRDATYFCRNRCSCHWPFMLSSISHGWFLGLKPSTQCVTADLLQMLPILFRLEYSWKSWKPFHLFHLLAAYFGKPFTFYLSKSMWEYAQQQRQKVVGYRRLQISWLLIYHPPTHPKKILV